MTVVNIRTGAPYDVYVGRPGPWGNPYRAGTKAQRVARYRQNLWARVNDDPALIADLAALHGKTLGCWCKPAPCHGDVLEAAAQWASRR